MRTLLVLLAACDAGMIPATRDDSAGVLAGRDGHLYAVVRLVAAREECSNLGGEHATLAIDEPAARVVHAGGHGVRLGFGATSSGNEVASDRYFIAELRTLTNEPGKPIRNPGWCLGELPRYHGDVARLVPVHDRADGQRRLAEIAARGMPKGAMQIE